MSNPAAGKPAAPRPAPATSSIQRGKVAPPVGLSAETVKEFEQINRATKTPAASSSTPAPSSTAASPN